MGRPAMPRPEQLGKQVRGLLNEAAASGAAGKQTVSVADGALTVEVETWWPRDHRRQAVRAIACAGVIAGFSSIEKTPHGLVALLSILGLAFFLPLIAGPLLYAVAMAATAVGLAALWDGSQGIGILFVLIVGLAAWQLPQLLALGVSLVTVASFAIGAFLGGDPGQLLRTSTAFIAAFAIGTGVYMRYVGRARQAAMMAALERAYAELRSAHEQLRLDSLRAGELAAAEERNRIAREIHDVLAHTLTVLVVQVGAVKRLVDRDTAQAKEQLDVVAGLLRDGLAEVRRSVQQIRSPAEEGVAALQRMVEAFAERTGTTCRFLPAENLPTLAPVVSAALYRLTQEALTNAVRHGEARTIEVRLGVVGDELVLRVQDDGIGAAAAGPVAGGGNGLRGARERIGALGGTVQAEPIPDGGFLVEAYVPVHGHDGPDGTDGSVLQAMPTERSRR